jgi:hypothetical protein
MYAVRLMYLSLFLCLIEVTFGYPKQPNLFINLDFGIDLSSRGQWKYTI